MDALGDGLVLGGRYHGSGPWMTLPWFGPMDALGNGLVLGGRYHGFGPWMLWGMDEVWVDVVWFAYGCSWETGNYQFFARLFP